MSILDLKEKYNIVIAREKKAEEYLKKCTDEQFDKWGPELNKIIVELSALMKTYEDLTGRAMTQGEVLNGF